MASMVANCLSALVVVFSCETGRSFLQTEDLSARHVAREKKEENGRAEWLLLLVVLLVVQLDAVMIMRS